MELSIVPVLIFLVAATTLVMAQGYSSIVDDIFEGNGEVGGEEMFEVRADIDVDTQFQFSLRELDEIRRRSTDQAKANAEGKSATKDWSKGKIKDKSNNAVVLDKATQDRLLKKVPKSKRELGSCGYLLP